MDVVALFKGVAIVIDDEANDPNANIANILSQIRGKNIPLLTFDKLPAEELVSHFQNLSIVLLDEAANASEKALAA